MEYIFDLTSQEALLNRDADHVVIEQLLLSDSMAYTYDMVLSDLYEERNRAVGATRANQEIERLRSRLIIWNYPAFDVEATYIHEAYDLPYSAAVCVAIARQLSCPVVTASHFSFDSLMQDEVCGVLFTR